MSPRVFRSLHKSRRQQEKPNKSNRKSLFEVLEDRRLLATVGFTAGADVVGMRQPPQTLETNRHELVIVDKATPDYRQLVAGLTGTGVGKPDVVYLDSRTDGVVAIGRILSQHSDLDAIHIVSHGQPGAVELGSVVLNAQNLPNYADSIRGWSAGLKGGGDILLYGCDVAANAHGQKLVEEIHELTGGDVAASTGETGSAALGGNWVLEFTAASLMGQCLCPLRRVAREESK